MDDIKILHLITDPTKFKIVQCLLQHPYCVSALAKKLRISESAVSQQLRQLKEYKIVFGPKIGNRTHYQVNRNLILSSLNSFQKRMKMVPLYSGNIDDCTCEFASDCSHVKKHGFSSPGAE